MYGKDFEYAATRLNETVVRYRDELVRVLMITPDCMCEVEYVGRDLRSRIKLDELNLKPLDLGYCNAKGRDAPYVYRVPKRNDWRQGTRASNLGMMSKGRFRDFDLDYADLVNTVKGTYPQFKKALELAKKLEVVRAWSRLWAVGPNGSVYHRGQEVGSVHKGTVSLGDKFKYLKESLQESL